MISATAWNQKRPSIPIPLIVAATRPHGTQGFPIYVTKFLPGVAENNRSFLVEMQAPGWNTLRRAIYSILHIPSCVAETEPYMTTRVLDRKCILRLGSLSLYVTCVEWVLIDRVRSCDWHICDQYFRKWLFARNSWIATYMIDSPCMFYADEHTLLELYSAPLKNQIISCARNSGRRSD